VQDTKLEATNVPASSSVTVASSIPSGPNSRSRRNAAVASPRPTTSPSTPATMLEVPDE